MTKLVNQPSAAPTRKVSAAMIALILAQFLADWLLSFLPPETLVEGPLLVATLEGVFVTVITFVAAYFVKDRAV